jgi:hypothetical protein
MIPQAFAGNVITRVVIAGSLSGEKLQRSARPLPSKVNKCKAHGLEADANRLALHHDSVRLSVKRCHVAKTIPPAYL